MTTSSNDCRQGGLVIVQRSVYVLPAVPVKIVLLNEASVKDPPVPVIIDQAPTPTAGLLPARVTVVKPQVAAPV